VVLNTDGNVFSGFTPLKWEFDVKWKRDDSLRSSLFTLTNPHGVPSKKVALKEEQKHCAIYRISESWAVFGWGSICVHDECNSKGNSFTQFGACDESNSLVSCPERRSRNMRRIHTRVNVTVSVG
jgi:hypothetical protein